MSNFSVQVFTAAGDPVSTLERLEFTPSWYSSMAVGGYEKAEIRVDGPQDSIMSVLRMIGNTIHIRNANYTLVWVGRVEEVLVTYGAMQVGLSIKNIVNRVKIAYTEATIDGTLERLTTDWAEDAESIARYGYSEKLMTKADVSTAQAEAYRDTMLATLKNPTPIIRALRGANAPTASMTCTGQWGLLERQLYSENAGLLEYNTSGGADQILGVGRTSAEFGFSNTKITDFDNYLDALPADVSVIISGSSSNDQTVRTIRNGVDGEVYTATTIAFDPSDDILDVLGTGLSFLNDYDIIDISGSSSNDEVRIVTNAINSEHITVGGTTIVTEAAGPSITITQAGFIETNTTFTNELPSATVTLTVHGVKVAQKFTLAADTTWTVNDIAIRVKKVGTPLDNVVVALYTDSGGSPDTLIESVSMAAEDIASTMAWKKFIFTNANSITYGTDYWIVVSRSGANGMVNYYVVDVAEDLGYAGGDLKLWTGAAWVARDPDADMPFIIRGASETTTQIGEILSNSAQFIDGYDLQQASGVESNQYREGDGTALFEIEKLLDSGTDYAARLLAKIDGNNILSIYEQPTSDIGSDLVMMSDGTLTQPNGVPVEAGVLPTAKWLRIHGIPQGVDHLAPLSKFFIERAEYHIDSGEWSLEPPGTDSMWDLGMSVE